MSLLNGREASATTELTSGAEGSGSVADVVLEVRGLTKHYGSTPVIRKVDLEVRRGETLTLLGPSGCGKSTTLRMIAGLERPDEGEIRINGAVVASAERGIFLAPEKRNVGLVFQSYAVWPHMTVEENVAYPLQVRRVPERERGRRVEHMLELTELSAFAKRPATQLSGGQQQRVALARALVYEPDLLLLDEPLSNLDAQLRHEMRIQLKRLQSALKTTMLFVTHDQTEAMALAHRIAIMRAGIVEQIDTPWKIYSEPASHFVHSFLGGCITFSGHRVIGGASDAVEIDGAGTIDLAGMPFVSQARDVRVSVRPQNMRIRTDGVGVGAPIGGPANHLTAVVEDTVFLGDRCECALRVGDTHRFVLEGPTSLNLCAGQSVVVEVDPAAVRIWPAG
jgi:ABC-type Fe3+/spermidine/putrescine transport system ATPase subunit